MKKETPGIINVFHLEKFTILRDAVCTIINSTHDMVCAGNGDDMKEFLKKASSLTADVLILDIGIEQELHQGSSGSILFCEAIRNYFPAIEIIIHSPYNHADWMEKFVAAGVKGFVSKQSGFDELLVAIRKVYAGELFICSKISALFKNLPNYIFDRKSLLKPLQPGFTSREKEVLDLLARGMGTKKIAETLFVSEKTVESHRKHLIDKANVKNTAELISFVSYRGLLFH